MNPITDSRRRRLRASPFRRCCRAWVRHGGRIVRLLLVSHYRPCEQGMEPREFVKRITHRRWPRGWHMFGVESSAEITGWHASLPADQWVECVSVGPESAA